MKAKTLIGCAMAIISVMSLRTGIAHAGGRIFYVPGTACQATNPSVALLKQAGAGLQYNENGVYNSILSSDVDRFSIPVVCGLPAFVTDTDNLGSTNPNPPFVLDVIVAMQTLPSTPGISCTLFGYWNGAGYLTSSPCTRDSGGGYQACTAPISPSPNFSYFTPDAPLSGVYLTVQCTLPPATSAGPAAYLTGITYVVAY